MSLKPFMATSLKIALIPTGPSPERTLTLSNLRGSMIPTLCSNPSIPTVDSLLKICWTVFAEHFGKSGLL